MMRPDARSDPFHSNSLYILSDTDAAALGPPFAAGQALISVLMMDTIVSIDLDAVETRHADVHDHHVRLESPGRRQGFERRTEVPPLLGDLGDLRQGHLEVGQGFALQGIKYGFFLPGAETGAFQHRLVNTDVAKIEGDTPQPRFL